MRRLKTVRRPPIYPKTPGHLPCSSLTHPLPLPSRRPSVSFGGLGLKLLSDMELAAAFGQGSCPQQLPCPNTRLTTGRCRAAADSRPRPGDRFRCDTLGIGKTLIPLAARPRNTVGECLGVLATSKNGTV